VQYSVIPSEEWILRKLCIDGLNERYDFNISDPDKDILLHKIAVVKSTQEISDRSVEELYTLAESYYSEVKKILIA